MEEQIVGVDFHDHEGLILIESRRRVVGRCQVTLAQLATRARDEVVNAILWLESLVDVVMP